MVETFKEKEKKWEEEKRNDQITIFSLQKKLEYYTQKSEKIGGKNEEETKYRASAYEIL